MKQCLLGMVALVVIAAPASASLALAKKNRCIACHAVEYRVVGPSYKQIAEKYANDKESAAVMLIAKVKTGGRGAWGQVTMPPNATLSDSDAKALVQWILSLK